MSQVTFTILPSQSDALLNQQIEEACELMQQHYVGGRYSKLTVRRSWSRYNPEISGSIARPEVFRWYLRREMLRLVQRGAEVVIAPSRQRVDLHDPDLLNRIDESNFDQTRKKAFLFGPERCELSIQRLEHYTGTKAEDFQRYVLLTNYQMHIDAFEKAYPDCVGPSRAGVQMPAHHHRAADNAGCTIINIGVGPSNAKTLTDHIAVLRPDAIIMVGHCAGVRNHQEVGDFVLASGYMRADQLLDEVLPPSVPITPNFVLNRNLAKVLDDRQLPYRYGVVYTTGNRNWELSMQGTLADLKSSRSIAVDMESATVAANGFRYRIPTATLLCVSDKPLHGSPKLPNDANEFYHLTKAQHLDVATAAIELAKKEFPGGFPNSDIRAMDEPLMGGPDE